MTLPKWDLDEAEGVHWVGAEAAYSLTQGMKEIYGFALTRNVVFVGEDRIMKWHTLTQELIDIGYKCLDKFKDTKFRKKLVTEFHNLLTKINQTIKDWQQLNPEELSLQELFQWLETFTFLYRDNFSYGFFAEPFDFIFPEEFEKVFANYNLTSEKFADLAALADTTYLNREMQELLVIACKHKKGLNIEKDFKEHYLKYEWIGTGHAGKNPLHPSYFTERLKGLIGKDNLQEELQHLQNHKQEILEKKQQVINKYKFPESVLGMIAIANEIGPLHDLRKEGFVKTIFYADDIKEEIAKRTGYTLEDLQQFELKELLPLQEGKSLDTQEIARRKEFVMLDVDATKDLFIVRSGADARKYITEFQTNYTDVHELTGKTASPGKAQGVVKVIFGAKESLKMSEGDVLITGMTRPEMMPAIKKAAAIVTDEGGLLCHAAIVAREFKIPCIIATQIASKVFKDGDLVEVDAHNAIVRRIIPKD